MTLTGTRTTPHAQIPSGERHSFVSLDGARGLASIFVMFHHFAAAFNPGLKASQASGGFQVSLAYVVFNGSAAVMFFFILSGFVLTVAILRRPTPRNLAAAVIKRLPRLAVPCIAASLLGCAILKMPHSYYKDAAKYSQSAWLGTFGNVAFPPNFVPTWRDSLTQSFNIFFEPNHFYYNSNLWTMFEEYSSSLLIFSISFFLLFRVVRNNKVIVFLALTALISHYMLISLPRIEFLIGAGLAYCVTSAPDAIKLSKFACALLLLIALFGLSTDDAMGNTLASATIIVVLVGNRQFAGGLSGRFGAWLGRLSFPLYLAHLLVILSLSSACFAAMNVAKYSPLSCQLATFAVTIVGSAILSAPFMALEAWWLPTLNRLVKSLVHWLFALPAAIQKALAPAFAGNRLATRSDADARSEWR